MSRLINDMIVQNREQNNYTTYQMLCDIKKFLVLNLNQICEKLNLIKDNTVMCKINNELYVMLIKNIDFHKPFGFTILHEHQEVLSFDVTEKTNILPKQINEKELERYADVLSDTMFYVEKRLLKELDEQLKKHHSDTLRLYLEYIKDYFIENFMCVYNTLLATRYYTFVKSFHNWSIEIIMTEEGIQNEEFYVKFYFKGDEMINMKMVKTLEKCEIIKDSSVYKHLNEFKDILDYLYEEENIVGG